MLVCVFVHSFAHETAGAASTRHSLRPLIFWANDFGKTSGAPRRENVDTHSIVIARLDRATQYAAASRLSSGVSGILDRPVKPGDDLGGDKIEFVSRLVLYSE
jgi:hypothetical protein